MTLSRTWDILGNSSIGRETSKYKIRNSRALLEYIFGEKKSQCNWSRVIHSWRSIRGQMMVVVGTGTFDLGPSGLLSLLGFSRWLRGKTGFRAEWQHCWLSFRKIVLMPSRCECKWLSEDGLQNTLCESPWTPRAQPEWNGLITDFCLITASWAGIGDWPRTACISSPSFSPNNVPTWFLLCVWY